MKKKIKSLECKFVTFIPSELGVRDDAHVVKEVVTYEDDTTSRRIRLIKNYQRPFYVTKEYYRNHKQKKESEDINKLNVYYSTQSDLVQNAAKRLPINTFKPTYRDVAMCPYLYGTDVDSRVFIKKEYIDRFGNNFTNYTVCVLDTEVNIDTDELILITVATVEHSYTAILRKIITGYPNVEEQLKNLYDRYIPKTDLLNNIEVEFEIVDNEIDLIKKAFNKVHSWQPDFLAIWNMSYDINVILNKCKEYDVDPKDIFSDPSLPVEYRYFNYKEDKSGKVTASGVNKPPGPQERWHIVTCPSSFYIIDAMCAYNYNRAGGKAVAGGYSLNNVLNLELGSRYQKLHITDEHSSKLVGIDWHRYMVSRLPLEYTIYNVWDVLSMLVLDDKTKDLSTTLPVLSGNSPFTNFKSGPKKIVDELYFFYKARDRILGCRSPLNSESEISLSNWIVLLPANRTADNGMRSIQEEKYFNTNTKTHTYDADFLRSKKLYY